MPTSMKDLKVITLGTSDYLEKFSSGLRKDCDQFGYQFNPITIRSEKNISSINHTILQEMVRHIQEQDFERLCFMDPECRIVKPIPNEWIESERPVVFFKARTESGEPDPKFVYMNKNGNGERLPCRIIGQPMFISKKDVGWFGMTLDLARSASDLEKQEYTRNEMFIETALEYNNIDYHREKIVYNRRARVPHRVVKGTWQTEDTIIQHPDIYGLFDHETISGNPVFGLDPVLDRALLERHTASLETLELINKHMWLEKSTQWQDFDEWSVNPGLGQIKLKGFDGVKYHHSILEKIEKNLITPAVRQFKHNNLTKYQ